MRQFPPCGRSTNSAKQVYEPVDAVCQRVFCFPTDPHDGSGWFDRLSTPAFAKETKPENFAMRDLIEEKDVNVVTLSLHLENAGVLHRLQEDGYIYVAEDGWFPFWIEVKEKPDFIRLATFINFRNSSTHLQRLEIANNFNSETYMGTSFIDNDDVLKISHMVSYQNGIFAETLISVLRQYSGGILIAINEFDPEHEILMQLSEMGPVNKENA